jgi:hypothetical protein
MITLLIYKHSKFDQVAHEVISFLLSKHTQHYDDEAAECVCSERERKFNVVRLCFFFFFFFWRNAERSCGVKSFKRVNWKDSERGFEV